jgi:hypothetical protein
MIFFGLFYPHFLKNTLIIKYIYTVPIGLIPCPTLSTIIGFSLLFNGFYSKSWSITLSILGLFYGFFGVIILKVYLDIFLIIGALSLLIFIKLYRIKNNERT